MILGTAGHIDHGKTALVRALTGVNTDRLPEERKRGITIDLGFAPLEITSIGTIGIVDVPGHEAFVRTMLAGASGIDLGMLVIAADEGIMPQTREHLEILSLLGIQKGVIALTKSDLVDDDWLAMVTEEIRQFVADSPLKAAEIVPVSTVNGTGVDEIRSAIRRLAESVDRTRDPEDLFRMPVDRAFTIKGAGTVVTGTVWSGTIRVDSTVLIQPGQRRLRVRSIQSHNRNADAIGPGTRAAIGLAGCDVADIGRGATIVECPQWMPSQEIDAMLEFSAGKYRPRPKTVFRIHIGTSETGARLSLVQKGIDGRVRARLILEDPVVARGGDRFVLRLPSPARTIGGGVVIDPSPLRHGRRAARAARGGVANSVHSTACNLVEMLELAAGDGIEIVQIPIRAGLVPSMTKAALDKAGAIVAGDRAYSRTAIAAIEEELERFIGDSVANHPLEPGVSLQTVRKSAGGLVPVVDLALERLRETGRIDISGSLVRPAEWDSRLSDGDKKLSDALMHEICNDSDGPPSVAELEAQFRGPVGLLLRRLEREGMLERISDDRYYAREASARMVEKLRSSMDPGRIYSPSELRAVLGVSRKYLIPFLEYCDRNGITRRQAAGRSVTQLMG